MGKSELFGGLGAFLQGISHGLMKKHLEEQETDKEISKGLKKFDKVQKLIDSDSRFQDPQNRRTLLSIMGIPQKQESETVEILRQLNVRSKDLEIEKRGAELAGTTPADKRADRALKLREDAVAEARKNNQLKVKIREDAAARAAQASQFKVQLGAVDKESSNLEALYKKWNDPLSGGIRKKLKEQYGDFAVYYLKKKLELENKRATLSAQASQAAQATPVSPGVGDTNIPESQDDDDLFQQLGY